jgi:hypothetical protein
MRLLSKYPQKMAAVETAELKLLSAFPVKWSLMRRQNDI